MRPDPLQPEQVNWAQFEPGGPQGHYESFYLRANHPARPLAFWLRYTMFSPAGNPDAAEGELWAVVFDRDAGAPVAAYSAVPIGDCTLGRDRFEVRIGDALLCPGTVRGAVGRIGWSLRYEGGEPPLYLLAPRFYRGGFPKAKTVVSLPLARFHGEVTVDGRPIAVDGWAGSQNHNWGSRHTDRYAFGQVAGFDGAPDSFLELASARSRVGPLWTPMLTPLVLRHAGRQHSLVSLRRAVRTASRYDATGWTFAAEDATVRIHGRIEAPDDAFVTLRYRNPPGGAKRCRNTKIARCTLEVLDKATGERAGLRSEHGALFEILDDDPAG